MIWKNLIHGFQKIIFNKKQQKPIQNKPTTNKLIQHKTQKTVNLNQTYNFQNTNTTHQFNKSEIKSIKTNQDSHQYYYRGKKVQQKKQTNINININTNINQLKDKKKKYVQKNKNLQNLNQSKSQINSINSRYKNNYQPEKIYQTLSNQNKRQKDYQSFEQKSQRGERRNYQKNRYKYGFRNQGQNKNNNKSLLPQSESEQGKRSQTLHPNYNKNKKGLYNQTKNIQYENRCTKFLKINTYQKLNQNQQQLQSQLRKLKKFIFETELIQNYDQKPKQISVYKSLQYPTIFLGYTYKNQKRYMLLSQINRSLKRKTIQYHETIKKVYQMHYYQVQFQYQNDLIEFFKLKAKQLKINLIIQKKYRQKGQKQIDNLFYYSINKNNSVQLCFFDQYMKQILLEQQQIQSKKYILKNQYKTFEKFIKSVKNQQESQIKYFGQEQIQSQDQKQINYGQYKDISKEIKQTQKRLKQLLNKNIQQLQEKMEKKNQELNEMISQNNFNIKQADKLAQQVDDLNRNLENFKKTKQQVQKKLYFIQKQQSSSKIIHLKNCLKRMIMASKQLQSKLPILGKKKQLFQMLDKNKLVILQGQTGSGKSTQLPQLLCQYYSLFQNPKAKPVLITQPRKIATRSLAQRVSEELQEPKGTFVDYTTSGTKSANPKAKIIFKLDRLVLDQLVESPLLQNYSCLVIDQAHQRTISIDVILGLVKKLLQQRNDFKVIITSASMQIALFQKYFKSKTLKVSGRLFPVNIKYKDNKQNDIVKKIQRFIDQQILTQKMHLKDQYKGHILVFCSDTSQIDRLTDIFQKKLNKLMFKVLPLHGKLAPEQQKKVFQKTKQYKLIFASRIAQTAITIDGVKVVIDPGFDRQMIYDQKTKFSTMKLKQISQSSAKQRAGRAGRTQEGYCFRLYDQSNLIKRNFNKLPQIQAIALQSLILRLKTLRINNVFDFDYIQPPSKEGMITSLQILQMIGCLDQKQNITPIGKFLVQIPIEPFLARSIIEGILMQKTIQLNPKLDNKERNLTQGIIQVICMVLNAGNLFRIPQTYRQKGQFIKYNEFSHQKGDFFFLKNIYSQYKIRLNQNRYKIRQWLHQKFLIGKTFIQVKQLVQEINSIIKKFSVDQKIMKGEIKNCQVKLQQIKSQQQRIISCLTTSFCANLALYSGNPFIGYTYMSQKKTMSIYGTSCLSLMGICPKWILSYDFYQGKQGKLYCKVAHQVTLDFLKKTVNQFIFDKFKIADCQKVNPFYKQIDIQLQTMIFRKIKNLYSLRFFQNRKEAEFLKQLDINFNQQKNKLSIFIQCQSKNLKNKTQSQLRLEKQIQNQRKRVNYQYRHNYIGNIFVKLGDGIIVKQIQFLNTQLVFQITNFDYQVYHHLYSDFSESNNFQSYGKVKIRYTPQGQQEIQRFQKYLQFLTLKMNKKFTYKKQLIDIRKKIPQTKIYLHWYAGKCNEKNNILLSYKNQQKIDKNNQVTQVNRTQQYFDMINLAINNIHHQNPRMNRQVKKKFGRIQMTKKGNAINIFNSQYDQIQLRRQLLKLIKENKISLLFKMPYFIKKFREPERPYCQIRNQQWQQKIHQILKKISDKKQHCIRVFGYPHYNPRNIKQYNKLSTLEKSYRVQMKAQIKTFDLNLLKNLQRIYDGKQNILGCEKLHITSMFDQIIAMVDHKVLQNLYDEYIYNVDNFKIEYPNIIFDVIEKQIKRNSKNSKRLIIVRSQNREDLIKPMRVLGQLFSPKYIILHDLEFRYLNTNKGGGILYKIEQSFQYKIYFGFDRKQRKLKLYCHDTLVNQVQKQLKQYLKQHQFHQQNLSYKGRNLKRIQKILQNKINQLQNDYKSKDFKFIQYQIKFTLRQINIQGDVQSFNAVKKQINQIKQQKNSSQNVCQICQSQLITPYKLFNCKHQFCWSCLSQNIREYKLSDVTKLKCSYIEYGKDQYCNVDINIHDVSVILSQEQLQKICDVKISKYIQSNKRYIYCKSPNCQQIFDLQDLGDSKSYSCQLCGRYYCLKCGQSHPNMTCQEWKTKDDLNDKKLLQMGIKKCPQCKTGIQKNKGCNHISCKCGAHLCWNCLQSFPNGQKCYDHLAKQCGGIFDPGYQN